MQRRIRAIRKRDGKTMPFDEMKIADAIFKAAEAVGGEDRFVAVELASAVSDYLDRHYEGDTPGIEDIQDMVEKVLIETGHAKTAKAYILYRDKRAQARRATKVRKATGKGTRSSTDTALLVDTGVRYELWEESAYRAYMTSRGAELKDVSRRLWGASGAAEDAER